MDKGSSERAPGTQSPTGQIATSPTSSNNIRVNGPVLTNEEVEEAFRKQFCDQCFYSCCCMTYPLELIEIVGKTPIPAYRYYLHTFIETRQIKDKSEPSHSGNLAPSYFVPPADKWMVPIVAPKLFATSKAEVELPNSSTVGPCHRCRASGYTTCTSCNGMGYTTCPKTHDNNNDQRCSDCDNTGRRQCTRCRSTGRTTCATCQSAMFLRHWKVLKVKWEVSSNTFHTERNELKRKHMKKALITEKNKIEDRVTFPGNPQPIQCNDPAINVASAQMIHAKLAEMQNVFDVTRIVAFMQTLSAFPITRVDYRRKGQEEGLLLPFYVFGEQNLAYFPNDVPSQCNCTIL